MGALPDAGRVVADRYELVRELGRGGTSTVWLATHRLTKKRVALKFLTGRGTTSRARVLREARAACAANHPHICPVHDVLEGEDGDPILVMEHLDGEPLSRVLEREEKLGVSRTADLIAQAASALGAAHAAGVVHRDVKPQNLFVRRDGRLLVVDFGIAKLAEADAGPALTETGSTPGTPAYMAPEQVFGERIDHRVDVWALGIVLYQCLSGVLPTAADNSGQVLKRVVEASFRPIRDLVPAIPDELAELVDAMISKDPRDRPADMRAVLEVLRTFAEIGVPPIDAPTLPAGTPATATSSVDESSLDEPGEGIATLEGTATRTDDRPASPPMATSPERPRRRVLAAAVVVAAALALSIVIANLSSSPATSSSAVVSSPVAESSLAAPSLTVPPTASEHAAATSSAVGSSASLGGESSVRPTVSPESSESVAPPAPSASARAPARAGPSSDPLGDRF